jgi:hypothetical protein
MRDRFLGCFMIEMTELNAIFLRVVDSGTQVWTIRTNLLPIKEEPDIRVW